jgi:hypothetical protein
MDIWGGVGRGIGGSSALWSGVCRGFVKLEDPNLSLSAPTGVQLRPTSPKLVEGEFCELLRLD